MFACHSFSSCCCFELLSVWTSIKGYVYLPISRKRIVDHRQMIFNLFKIENQNKKAEKNGCLVNNIMTAFKKKNISNFNLIVFFLLFGFDSIWSIKLNHCHLFVMILFVCLFSLSVRYIKLDLKELKIVNVKFWKWKWFWFLNHHHHQPITRES